MTNTDDFTIDLTDNEKLWKLFFSTVTLCRSATAQHEEIKKALIKYNATIICNDVVRLYGGFKYTKLVFSTPADKTFFLLKFSV